MASIQPFPSILTRYPSAHQWLQLLSRLGRAPATLDAYARALAHYFSYCEASSQNPETGTFEQVTLYVRGLLPGEPQAVANSTLHQRLTAIRLWYDHLVFSGRCSKNPVPRGQHTRMIQAPGHAGFSRGLIPRLIKLPEIPTDEEWERVLRVAASAPMRDRLMLALAYYGALRRAELIALRVEDLDFAHRLVRLRAETTKGKRTRIVCYSPDIAPGLAQHLQQLRRNGWHKGPLFRSDSDRNRGEPVTRWTWSKVVAAWGKTAGTPSFSTHSLRHLRLTYLARAGWKLHELTTYAGHRDPKTTLMYLHLSGADLTAKMAQSVGSLDARVARNLFDLPVPYYG